MNSGRTQSWTDPANAVSYFFSATRASVRAADASSAGSREEKSHALATILLACAAVEAFLNAWCQESLNEPSLQQGLKNEIQSELSNHHFPIWEKLTKWPNRLIAAGLPNRADGHPPYKPFVVLYEHRNRLVHFRASNETIHAQGFTFESFADVTDISTLSKKDAMEAVVAAEDVVREITRIQYLLPGYPEWDDKSHRHWIGVD